MTTCPYGHRLTHAWLYCGASGAVRVEWHGALARVIGTQPSDEQWSRLIGALARPLPRDICWEQEPKPLFKRRLS